MRIYTEIIWSWDDEKGELVRESSKSYDYEGPLTFFGGGYASVNQRIADNVEATSNDSFGKYPENVGSDEYPHYILFTARRSYTSSQQSRRGTPNGSVALYMPPDALKTSYSQSIGDIDMKSVIGVSQTGMSGGDIASGAMSKINKASSAVMNADFGKAASALGGNFNVLADVASAGAADVVNQAFSQTALKQAIERASGKILNPHKAVVYQGPNGFRTFSYTFVMVPKSESEAEEIFNIVRFFKKRMHPDTGAGGINSLNSLTLSYPDEFSIQYFVNNEEVDGSSATKPLFKIHNCFMETFSADYSTSGLVSFMDDNNPLTTTVTMSFKETQLITKSDIDKGY